MRRYSSALVGAVVAAGLVASSAPAQAESPRVAPAVMTGDQSVAIENVGDRRHGKRRYRYRDDDDFRFGFSFGAPYAYYQPRHYRPVYRCPYGYWYNGYGCVVYRSHPQPYYYHGYRPGVSFHFGF